MERLTGDYIRLDDEFLENPFSVLDTRTSRWQGRKKELLSLCLNDNTIRKNLRGNRGPEISRIVNNYREESYVSTFDPYLSMVMYRWFGKRYGNVLDPFCGGITRGVIAEKCGMRYTGIDIREEQINSNISISREILGDNKLRYICGDSDDVLDTIKDKYNMIFTCPPYFNLEKYSELPGDLSNMTWESFKGKYYSIIKKSCNLLKKNSYAVVVIGEVRARNGAYYGLVPYTIKCFMNCGMQYYNEMILSHPVGSAHLRARMSMKYNKIVKIHQNVLVFKKHRVVNVENERL